MQSSRKAMGRWKIRLDFRGRRRERGGAQVTERMWQRPGGRPHVAWRSEGLPPAACPARHGVRLRKPGKPNPVLAFSERPAAKAAGLRRKRLKFYELWPAPAKRRAARFFLRRPLHYPTLQLPQALMRASADGLRHLAPTWVRRRNSTPENPVPGPRYRERVARVARDPAPAGNLQTRQHHF